MQMVVSVGGWVEKEHLKQVKESKKKRWKQREKNRMPMHRSILFYGS